MPSAQQLKQFTTITIIVEPVTTLDQCYTQVALIATPLFGQQQLWKVTKCEVAFITLSPPVFRCYVTVEGT